jgi:hypothetical protein
VLAECEDILTRIENGEPMDAYRLEAARGTHRRVRAALRLTLPRVTSVFARSGVSRSCAVVTGLPSGYCGGGVW